MFTILTNYQFLVNQLLTTLIEDNTKGGYKEARVAEFQKCSCQLFPCETLMICEGILTIISSSNSVVNQKCP